MAGEDQNPESQFPTAQMPNTPLPPGVAPAAPAASAQAKGPFSSYLDPSQVREPTHVASKERPSGYMGPAGKMAMVLDQFLGGLAKGRATAYNRSIQEQEVQRSRIGQQIKSVSENPDLSETDRMAALKPLLQAQASFGMHGITPDQGEAQEKKGGKKGKDQEHPNPILNFMGKAFQTIGGPGAQPQPITPQTVDQAIGASYGVVAKAAGVQQQRSEAWAAMLGAIGEARKNGAKTEAEAMADPAFKQAATRYASTVDARDHEKAQAGTLNALKQAFAEPKSNEVWEATTSDGKKIPVVRQGEQFINPDTKEAVTGITGLKRPGTDTASEKRTDIHYKTPEGEWVLGQEDASGKKYDKDGHALKPDDFTDVNKSGAKPDKYPGALGIRYEAQKIIANPKSTPGEIKAAKDTLSDLAQKSEGLSLTNALRAIGYKTKKEALEKFKEPELKAATHGVFNDVLMNKDPAVQAWVGGIRDRLLKAKDNPQDAEKVADQFREAVLGNVKDDNNYLDLTDEQREQIKRSVRGMDWRDMVPFVKGTASGKPGGHIGSLTADVAKLQAGGTPAAAGTPAATPAAPMRSSTPPGMDKPAPKPAAAASAAPAAPKAKVLGTESQLRVKAKAAGRTPAEIDQMVKEYKQAGYIQ